MKADAHIYVFLSVSNICDRCEYQDPEDVVERQPEMIKREKYCYQYWREAVLNAEMRCQKTSEKQFLGYRSDDHIE